MEPLRLQKFIASQGLASRREAEDWIRQGRVQLNGKVVKTLGVRLDPEKDKIKIDGKTPKFRSQEKIYWICFKPDLVLTARNPEESAPEPTNRRVTLYDLPKLRKMETILKPVGRLDFRTEGLLILTNDGEMANRLMHPRYQIPRVYKVWARTPLTDAQIAKVKKGIWIGDGMVRGAHIRFSQRARGGPGAWYEIELFEGRNRVVRRIFEALRVEIKRLIRVSYGGIRIPHGMPPGDCRPLSRNQIEHLRSICGLTDLH